MLLKRGRPDLVLYQAAADPLKDDPYSPLELSQADLLERDQRVLEFARRNSLPLAWVLAGGYAQDITKVVEVHLNTFRAAAGVLSGSG
jgi:acetoin utilization deacetylase AcuC-like enzyme